MNSDNLTPGRNTLRVTYSSYVAFLEAPSHFRSNYRRRSVSQAAEGTGLAFIVFTQAIVELPGAPFWAICFFLMLITLGLGSQFGTMEGVITTVFDMKIFRNISKSVLSGRCFCRARFDMS